MASLNINSLLAHIDQLRVVMSSSEIDVLSINETKLYLPGFEIIRKEKGERVQWWWCVLCNLNYKISEDLSTEILECFVLEFVFRFIEIFIFLFKSIHEFKLRI